MKKIDNYIQEKLYIDKNFKAKKSIEEEIDDILMQARRQLKDVLSWKFEDKSDDEHNIIRIHFPQYCVMYFTDFKRIFTEKLTYKIKEVSWSLSSAYMDINYE